MWKGEPNQNTWVNERRINMKTLSLAPARLVAGVWIFAILLASTTSSRAEKQVQMNQDACAVLAQADEDLNALYRRILAEYASAPQFTEKLQDAQRAWVAFRDAHLEAVYPAPDKQAEYGSAYPLCRCLAMTELTQARLEDLKHWLTGVPEGEVCRGSVRTKVFP
jgi:uncharacterized protein YecT (DUF1311 family)